MPFKINSLARIFLIVLIATISTYAGAALSQGVSGTGTLESAIPLDYKTLEVDVAGSYFQGDKLGLLDPSNRQPLANVGGADRSDYSLAIAYGLLPYLETSLLLPYYRDVNMGGVEHQGLGDMRLSFKFNYPPYPHKDGFKLSLLMQLDAPTSTSGEDFGYTRHAWYTQAGPEANPIPTRSAHGSLGPAVSTRMLTTANFGAIDGMIPLLLHLNWGATFTDSRSQNAFQLGGGAEITPHPLVTAFWSFYSEIYISGASKNIPITEYPFQSSAGLQFNIPKAYLEVYGGAHFVLNEQPGIVYSAPADANASTPFAARVPELGFFAGLTGRFSFAPKDRDEDGVLDRIDRCPTLPEDQDGFQDEDGCPDLDNDNDGILDSLDKCPVQKEDVDGFQDDDGCPDPDNDKDGIADKVDRCPNDAEDADGFQDDDGCPDVDNDSDGIPDAKDKCPMRPEDVDTFEDGDGCPDLDNDRDGIPDNLDRCPMQAEVVNGVDDGDGCPD